MSMRSTYDRPPSGYWWFTNWIDYEHMVGYTTVHETMWGPVLFALPGATLRHQLFADQIARRLGSQKG